MEGPPRFRPVINLKTTKAGPCDSTIDLFAPPRRSNAHTDRNML
jgi:hypothetical protein